MLSGFMKQNVYLLLYKVFFFMSRVLQRPVKATGYHLEKQQVITVSHTHPHTHTLSLF